MTSATVDMLIDRAAGQLARSRYAHRYARRAGRMGPRDPVAHEDSLRLSGESRGLIEAAAIESGLSTDEVRRIVEGRAAAREVRDG